MEARRGCGGAERGPPPVLILSHFCPKPFVCFGDLRPGASRTLPLAVLNPNAEAASVTLPRGPAADRGFHVWPSAFELQPKEKIVISVNWTPLQEGRVREILTFLVNDILKHEVILLGNVEEPKKKKRSLWDTIKKKKASSSSRHTKRISNIPNVNKTFSVPQRVDRVRSPLQACENLGGNGGCSPTESKCLVLQENKMPISPIRPTFRDYGGDAGGPLCVWGSAAYTAPQSPEDGELWTRAGAHIRQESMEEITPQTPADSVTELSGQVEDGRLVLTPNCSSPLSVTQSQGRFLSPDSFAKNSRHPAHTGPESVTRTSSDTFLKDDSRPVPLESETVSEMYRAILSPDSFIKDNYGLNQKLESEPVNPFVSPNQFLRENMPHIFLSPHTCKLSLLSKENSGAPQSPPEQRKNGVLPYRPECQGSNSPKAIFEEPKALEMKPDGYRVTKQKQPKVGAVQDNSGQNHNTQPKGRPILSATVTKLKPTVPRENSAEPSKPKARRRLRSVAGEGEGPADSLGGKDAFHPYLPVIDPVGSNTQRCNDTAPSSKTALEARKRKSEGNGEGANVVITVTEHAEEQGFKGIHFSPAEYQTSTAKKTKVLLTPDSRPGGNRGRAKPRRKMDSLAFKTPNSKTHKRTPRIVPVAQSSLTFIKRLKTDIPRHPMPFAAKNVFYDERWKEKQQQGFSRWLNFILTPDDFSVRTGVAQVDAAALLLGAESRHKESVPRAPTKDEASLRAYTARCRLNRLRRAACRLFTSERMVRAIRKLEVEMAARRLAVRTDRHLWKDVGERQKVLSWLLSYNPLWLRIGLETVFGELIALEDNSDVTGLAVFILSRVLWNPDIAAEYRHPCVPHLYRAGHEEALSAFTLKKLLLVVCFLDYAKVSRLIDHDPCLFCKDSEFKTSKEVLLALSRDFLRGEGDLCRHLSWLGLPVSHVQTPLDEFDFAVTNLAVDLQCGVRLVRTMELLTRNWDLSKQLRVPAISRLQKMHNVDIALQVLRSRGIPLQDEHGSTILSKDIVDRHREKTLALLWKIALAFQVDISLNLDELKEEISFLKRVWRMKKPTSALSCHSDTVLSKKTDTRQSGSLEQRSESIPLLMEWVNAVCAFYGTKVENFTVSFSDGRVLCYLVHHYHPGCVPLDAIRQRTSQTVACAQSGSVVLNSSSESDESCLDLSPKALELAGKSELHRELLENERRNFQLLRSAARDLGGIPAMIQHADMSNTIPDEKVVVTYLSFLCARLLDLRREARAARLIQAAWRGYKRRADLRRRQERDKAARTLQAAALGFLTKRRLQQASAARVIQKHWRRRRREVLTAAQAQLEREQNKSALLIQRNWRRYSARKQFLSLRHHAVILQARIRMKIALASYRRRLWAAVTIQRHWRACVRRREDQRRSETLRSSCLVIQAAFRRWRCRRVSAAVPVQRPFRAWRAREESATAIQAWYRMHRELRSYSRIRACVVVIQTRFRSFRAQKLYQRKRESALTIQRHWRAHLEGRAERARARDRHRQTRAALVLQSHWRMRRERSRFLNLRRTAIQLQARVRRHQQLRNYRKMRQATLVIQAHFRAHVRAREARAAYRETRTAVLVLQAACRGARARRQFRHALSAVVKIQARYRARMSRRRFLSLKRAAVQLQSLVRMKQARAHYLGVRAAALRIQRWFRALRAAAARREARRRLRACVRLQAVARGYLVRRRVRRQRSAAVALQAHFRMRRARRRYLRLCRAALAIQSHYRARRGRQRIQRQSAAARKIQAAFRGYRARARYRRLLQAALRVQRWYRAHRAVRALRARLSQTRTAALALQAAYRGWKVRERIRRAQRAALKIQAAFRAARARRRFLALRAAALVLQRRWRARAAGVGQRAAYAGLRRAALTLQAVWRGRVARSRVRRLHECAARIQARYRMHAQRRAWGALRGAARLVQLRYRARRLGRQQRLLYLRTKAAAVTLQRAFRGVRARRAAVVLQAHYRAHRARKRYAACRAAAVAIQRWYRSVGAAHQQRRQYLRLREAATRVQAAYRGLRVRRRLQQVHGAATAIQAVVKMHQSKGRFHRMRAAAVVIQVRFRAYCQGRAQRAQYLAILGAVAVLQARWRGARVRRTLRERRRAAVVIQTCYRRHRARRGFEKLKEAAETVQRRYRAAKAGGAQCQRYAALRRSAVRVQAAFRGRRARRHLEAMHLAASLIQRRFRTLMMRRRFLSLRKTAVWVQRRYRANLRAQHHLQFLRLQEAAIKIQAAFRGWMARERLREGHRAAAVVQAAFRGWMARKRLREGHRAAAVVQAAFRGWMARKRLREGHRAAAVVQAAFRGWMARKRLRERHRAAAVVQAAFRGWMARKRLRERHRAAAVVQAAFRGWMARKRLRERHRAAAVVQAAFRGWMARKRLREGHRAAAVVQAAFRGWMARKRLRERHRAAAVVQAAFRGWMARKRLREGHRAAAVVQAAFRTHRARARLQALTSTPAPAQQRYRACRAARPQRDGHVGQRPAAGALPAAAAGAEARRRPREQPRAAVVIQSAHRRSRQRRSYQEPRGAVQATPEQYRAKAAACTRAGFQDSVEETLPREPRQAALTVQEHPRALRAVVLVQRRYRAARAARNQAAPGLQSCRGLRGRGDADRRHWAATLVQAVYRMHRARAAYRAKRGAAAVLQRRCRACVRGAAERKPLAAQRCARAAFTGDRAGQTLGKVSEDAASASPEPPAARCDGAGAQQDAARSSAARPHSGAGASPAARAQSEAVVTAAGTRDARDAREWAALRVQAFLRMAVGRSRFVQLRRAVLTVQRCFRARQARRRFLLLRRAALALQTGRHARASARHQRRVYLLTRRSAVVIQAWARGFLQRRKFQRMRDSAVKIQALWRGYSLRKKNECAKIKAIRSSLQLINGEAREEDRLCRRTELALYHLLTYKHLSAVLEALKHLEVVTRLSPLCCESMAQSGAIPKIFLLIQSCNRSVPCMEVVSYAVQVLLNVAKYEKTTSAVSEAEGCVDALLALLRTYRGKAGDKIADKSGGIFTKTCCLLAVLLKAASRASDVRNRSKVVDCVYSIYRLTARKHQVDTERELSRLGHSSSVGAPCVPETPVRTRLVARLKPDWVLRRDNIQEITNPLQAIQLVMDTLGVPCQ